MTAQNSRQISIRVPETIDDVINKLISMGIFKNRSEFINFAIQRAVYDIINSLSGLNEVELEIGKDIPYDFALEFLKLLERYCEHYTLGDDEERTIFIIGNLRVEVVQKSIIVGKTLESLGENEPCI